MDINLAVIAGAISTTIFALSNVGNVIHSIYVFLCHLAAARLLLGHYGSDADLVSTL